MPRQWHPWSQEYRGEQVYQEDGDLFATQNLRLCSKHVHLTSRITKPKVDLQNSPGGRQLATPKKVSRTALWRLDPFQAGACKSDQSCPNLNWARLRNNIRFLQPHTWIAEDTSGGFCDGCAARGREELPAQHFQTGSWTWSSRWGERCQETQIRHQHRAQNMPIDNWNEWRKVRSIAWAGKRLRSTAHLHNVNESNQYGLSVDSH